MIKKKRSSGIHLLPVELSKIVDWLNSDLMMSARTVQILISGGSGIGQTVIAIALDEDAKEIARINATDYEKW